MANLSNPITTLSIELPTSIHAFLQRFLSEHPGWERNEVLQAGLCLFLMQNGNSEAREVVSPYLDLMFGKDRSISAAGDSKTRSLTDVFNELREQFGDAFENVDREDLL
ncbi:MAG: DUF2811 domain-containing protein [Cyanobacteria bacterium P01_A01_bin.17]